jgi:hypothetical protein
MDTNIINYYRVTVEGYKPTEISVKRIEETTYFCRFNCINFINEFNVFGFIVEAHKYGEHSFISHGDKNAEDFIQKAWNMIFLRLDTPDYSEKL